MNTPLNRWTGDEAGFSLVETLVAMGILATGLLSLAGVFSLGMLHLAGSSSNLIAREKAREAVESVHTARDTKTITWSQIRNVADGGVFLKEPQPLRKPGLDGLVNTADDAADVMEEQLGPGRDNVLGTADDVQLSAHPVTRARSSSSRASAPLGEDTLRKLTVKVTYPVGKSIADLHADHVHLVDFMSRLMATTAAHTIPAGRQGLPAEARRVARSEGGFSLVELLVTMSITTVILGATMSAMTHAINATDLALQLTTMNNSLRTSMDVMVRDMLQVGQGLPSGNVVLMPTLAGSTPIKLPTPPFSPALTYYLGATGVAPNVLPRLSTTSPGAANGPPSLSAVLPGPGLGPDDQRRGHRHDHHDCRGQLVRQHPAGLSVGHGCLQRRAGGQRHEHEGVEWSDAHGCVADLPARRQHHERRGRRPPRRRLDHADPRHRQRARAGDGRGRAGRQLRRGRYAQPEPAGRGRRHASRSLRPRRPRTSTRRSRPFRFPIRFR